MHFGCVFIFYTLKSSTSSNFDFENDKIIKSDVIIEV